MNIEIITTPNEALKETGFGSYKACNSVLQSIRKMDHDVLLSVCKTKADLDAVVERKPDLVVLAVKYIPIDNEADLWVSAFFADKGINFSGSSRAVLKFDSDKSLAKSHLRKKGIKTANYFTALPGEFKIESELLIDFPLFLKPLDAANGNGVDELSFVTNFEDFESKIASLFELYHVPVLVEEYLDGREFTVSVLRQNNGALLVSPMEIIPPETGIGLRILGEKAKRDDSEELKKTEGSELTNDVIQLAINAFIELGARDFGRIDIKANKQGECFFMEANLVPGMTFGSSYFPKACEIENHLNYDDVIELIVEEGLSRVPPILVDFDQFNFSPKTTVAPLLLAKPSNIPVVVN